MKFCMKFPFFIAIGILAMISIASGKSPKPGLRPVGDRFGQIEKAESPSFRRHVLPLVGRAGCNSRECHGSFSGQGGFALSLFGYDFEQDHREMTQDADGGEDLVRIDAQHPEQSLLLRKPTMQMKHKGKERFATGSWEYNLLLQWIKNGAKNDVEETGDFDRLEVSPPEIVFKKTGDHVQLKVRAHWKDGTIEDVTQLTRFRSNDESVATVSATGRVECVEKGDTHIVAFYDNGVQPIPVMLPMSNLAGSRYPKVKTATTVDKHIVAKLRKLGIVPSERCTDLEFLRRARLDVTGTLPTPSEVETFLADRSSGKRAAKIEELLSSPAYAAWWSTKLCDFAGNSPRRLSSPTGDQNFFSELLSRQWYEWIYGRVEKNEPYDKIMEGVIMAKGRVTTNQTYKEFATEMSSYFRSDKEKAADFAERPNMPYFWQRNNIKKPAEKALAFAHTFLGVRIECAECHKHPFDQWTKTDFQQFQAFFEPIQYNGRPGRGEEIDFRTAQKEFLEWLGPEKSAGQKIRAEAFKKQIDEDVVLPWPEVYIAENTGKKLTDKEIAKRKKLDPNFSSRVLTPKILGGEEVLLNGFSDPRQPLMDWLRSKENPYFARAFVNRVWENYFGRGIVQPADDMNLANPPSNAELLDYLAQGFVSQRYDMKWLHREILSSDAYQRSWKPTASNKLDEKNFSRMLLRRLPAEVAIDAFTQATAIPERLATFEVDIRNRAIGPSTIASDGRRTASGYALTIFGKPTRDMNCDCERVADPSLLQTIFTRNDPELLTSIDNRGKDSMAWIAELRREYGSKAALAKLELELKKIETTEKRLQAEAKKAGLEKGPREVELQRLTDRRKSLQEEIAAAQVKRFDEDRIIHQLFLRTVSRPPNPDEITKAKEDIAAAKDPVDGVRDVLWAMLNTREFIVNH